jgi:hypothetical protein
MDNVRSLKHKKNQSKAKGWTCSTKQEKKKHHTERKESEGGVEEWVKGRTDRRQKSQRAADLFDYLSLSLWGLSALHVIIIFICIYIYRSL